MREVLTEFDELINAMEKINLNESIMPYVNGRLVNSDSYNKVQKILDCKEMISSHKWLYELDLDQLEEDEITKINKLYDLGCDRGFIEDDLTHFDDDGNCIDDYADSMMKDYTSQEPQDNLPQCKDNFTVIYSATDKNGTIKTGEAFSNACSSSDAKNEILKNLSKVGYDNITILAIEKSSTDESDESFNEDDIEEDDMLKGRHHNGHIEEDDIEEDDMLKGRHHNGHIEEDDDSDSDDGSAEDDSDSEDTTDDFDTEDADDDSDTEDTTDDSADDSDEDDFDTDDSSEGDDTEDDDSDTEDADDDSDTEDDDSDTEDTDDDTEDDDSDTEDTEDADDDSEDDDSAEELTQEQKNTYKNDYKKMFKNTLIKCKFNKSFDELTIKEKVKFLTELGKVWTKNEPTDFMSDKEIDQLNKTVVKSDDED